MQTRTLVTALGLGLDGKEDVLGPWSLEAESASAYAGVLTGLKAREERRTWCGARGAAREERRTWCGARGAAHVVRPPLTCSKLRGRYHIAAGTTSRSVVRKAAM